MKGPPLWLALGLAGWVYFAVGVILFTAGIGALALTAYRILGGVCR